MSAASAKPADAKKSIVGIGAVCAQVGSAEMIAYALGSCIALCLYDSQSGVGAMAHILLPSARYAGRADDADSASTKYADHALACALEKMAQLGANPHTVEAAMVGGAAMFPHGNLQVLNIGRMNVESITQELEARGIPLRYRAVGGDKSRTVAFRIPGNGFDEQLSVKSPFER